MSIEAEQLIQNIIRPTLKYLGVWTEENESLLAGTAAKETGFTISSYSEVDDAGLGIFAITAEKHRHVWDHYLAFQPDLASEIRGLASQRAFLNNPELELVTNLAYATAIAWIIYKEAGLEAGSYNSLKHQAHAWCAHFHHAEPCEEQNFL